ncbi:MAG TPA: PASTA domain-containing protein [Treponemataceae bacterium]|nr:PASTA domain-containing protein [Treponemataceae bacterium]
MKYKLSQFGLDFDKIEECLKTNWKLVLSIVLTMVIVLAIVSFTVFFLVVKSPEKVLVPDLVGKNLPQALEEMQSKELYPRVRLRYSGSPDDKGSVLEQKPVAGAIVKAGRRIEIVVSNGAVLNQVEDYVGQSIDQVRAHLQTLFAASSRPMITLPDAPSYQEDDSEAGIILSQNPQPGTDLVEPITLDIIVSSGPGNEKATIPYLIGMTMADVHVRMARTKLVFQFSGEATENAKEVPGSVVSQRWPEDGATELATYSWIDVKLAIPKEPVDGITYGIYETALPPYPYALDVSLEAKTPDKEEYTIVAFKHHGGKITIPYAVPVGTTLVLEVLGQENSKLTVQ